jgi:hypothetical protein
MPHHRHHAGRDDSAPENGRHGRHDRASTITTNPVSGSSYVSPLSSTDTEKPVASHHDEVDIEKEMQRRLKTTEKPALATTARLPTSVIIHTIESESEQPETLSPLQPHGIASGRPDTASLIAEAVMTAKRGERVLVAACGPESLLTVVRDATAKLIKGDGPGVELHCEQFGW